MTTMKSIFRTLVWILLLVAGAHVPAVAGDSIWFSDEAVSLLPSRFLDQVQRDGSAGKGCSSAATAGRTTPLAQVIAQGLAAARRYEQTVAAQRPDAASRTEAEQLFRRLTLENAFVTGELGDSCRLFDAWEQSQHLTPYNGDILNTLDMLRLAAAIYGWDISNEARREAINNYYERALYNQILGAQDTLTGRMCRFTPLMTGGCRTYDLAAGTLPLQEVFTHYIFVHQGNDLYVNLFVPAQLNWEGTVITQQTRFPYEGRVVYTISGRPRTFTLHTRWPLWATRVTVRVNGKKMRGPIRRLWQAGDKVEVDYGMALTEEFTHGDATRMAVLYGPILLSGETGSEARVEDCRLRNGKNLRQVAPLHYVSPSGIEVKPFFDTQRGHYVVYWRR